MFLTAIFIFALEYLINHMLEAMIIIGFTYILETGVFNLVTHMESGRNGIIVANLELVGGMFIKGFVINILSTHEP